jgi:hypothetical protein
MNQKAQTHPIAELECSAGFQEACRLNGFDTLERVLEVPVEELKEKHDFSNHQVIEFVRIAKRLGMDGLIKEGNWR